MQVPDDFDELRHFDRVRLGKGSGSDDADSRRAGGGNPNWRMLRSLQTHVAKRDDESPGKIDRARRVLIGRSLGELTWQDVRKSRLKCLPSMQI